MSVMVEEVTMAKSQKSRRVKLSGSWYGSYLDSGIENQVGKLIEAEIVTLDKGGPWIKAWKASTGAAPQVPPSQSQAAPAAPAAAAPHEPKYAEPAKPGTVAPWFMPFISNTVNAAITAGHIKTPNQIQAWALAARGAALAAEKGQSADDIDSDVPF